jgi:hypothetical protein
MRSKLKGFIYIYSSLVGWACYTHNIERPP